MVITKSVSTASREIDRLIRRKAGAGANVPIVVVSGSRSAPRLLGTGGYYTTPGGARIDHPNAYRRAWGKPVYHGSTLRVEVGGIWVCLRLARIPAERDTRPSLAERCGLKKSTPVGIVRDRAIELGFLEG